MRRLPEHAIVMHPGPMNRGMEIAPEVADSAALHDRRTGRQRRLRADGRPLPAARRASSVIMLKGGPSSAEIDRRAHRTASSPSRSDRRDRDGRRRRADRAARARRPAHPPARAGPRGRRDGRVRLRGRRRSAATPRSARWPTPSPVADTAGVVEQVWRLGREAGLVDVQPVGAVTVGPGRRAARRARRDGRLRRAGPGLLRRRALRRTTRG